MDLCRSSGTIHLASGVTLSLTPWEKHSASIFLVREMELRSTHRDFKDSIFSSLSLSHPAQADDRRSRDAASTNYHDQDCTWIIATVLGILNLGSLQVWQLRLEQGPVSNISLSMTMGSGSIVG